MTEPVAVPTALLQRSNQDGLRQLAAHVLLLGVTGTTIFWTRGTLWLVPAILLQGIVLVCVFCPLHETTHRTAFASRNLNRTVGWLCGALLLLPPEFFRQFHFAHHRYAQDAARDPELAQPAPASFGVYLWRASGLPNWQRRLSVTLRHALTGRVTEPFVPAHQHAAIVAEARILWLNYGYLEDMLNDAAFALKLGRPLDDLLIAELLKFKWKDDGCHVKDGMEPGDMVFGYDVPAEATRHRSATQPSKLGATEALEAPK